MANQTDNGTSQIAMTVSVLGIPVHVVSMAKVVEVLYNILDTGKRLRVVTLNPEMIMWARKDESIDRAIRGADLTVPDGIGVVWAMRRSGFREQSRIAGVDLIENLLDEAGSRDGLRVYILGGRPGVAEEAGKRIKARWPSVEIVGIRHGYFSPLENDQIIREMNNMSPELLLVGMGVPRQEIWLAEHWERLNVNLGVGIGGGLDIWAAKARRAPRIVRKLGLEWLFRTILQPSRITRLLVLPRFVLEVARCSSSNGRYLRNKRDSRR